MEVETKVEASARKRLQPQACHLKDTANEWIQLATRGDANADAFEVGSAQFVQNCLRYEATSRIAVRQEQNVVFSVWHGAIGSVQTHYLAAETLFELSRFLVTRTDEKAPSWTIVCFRELLPRRRESAALIQPPERLRPFECGFHVRTIKRRGTRARCKSSAPSANCESGDCQKAPNVMAREARERGHEQPDSRETHCSNICRIFWIEP